MKRRAFFRLVAAAPVAAIAAAQLPATLPTFHAVLGPVLPPFALDAWQERMLWLACNPPIFAHVNRRALAEGYVETLGIEPGAILEVDL